MNNIEIIWKFWCLGQKNDGTQGKVQRISASTLQVVLGHEKDGFTIDAIFDILQKEKVYSQLPVLGEKFEGVKGDRGK